MTHRFTALAFAAAMGAAGSASAASFQINDSTELSVYGDLQLKYNTTTNEAGDDESAFTDNGSTIGFGAEHRFDNGLTAFGTAEFEHNADEAKNGDGLNSGDQAFLGLSGNFGRVQAGSFDSIYSDAIYDLIDPFETASVSAAADSAEGDTIAYMSPDFGGFSFEVAGRIRGEADTGADSEEVGFAAVATYGMDNWAVNVGYDERGANDLGGGGFDEGETYGIGAAYSLDRVDLAARYSISQDADGEDETSFLGALVGFDYGRGDIYGVVQEVDPDGGDSRTEFAIGANYVITDNMYVFTEYGTYDRQNDAGDLFEVGAVYVF